MQTATGYLAAPTGNFAQVAFYDRQGHLQRAFGRRGEGPGEFANIRSAAPLPNGSIVVLDARLTVISPDGKVISARALPPGIVSSRIGVLPDGRILLNNYGPNRPAICVFDATVQFVRCFGATATSRRTAGDELQRLLAPAPDGTIWAAAQRYAYSIERWDTLGRPLQTLALNPPWFKRTRPADDLHLSPTQARPEPRVSGIWVDPRGRLWTTVLVPDAHWRAAAPAKVARREGSSAPFPTVDEWGKYYDTMIEVLDPAAGRVIASVVYPGVVGQFAPTGLITEFQVGVNGDVEAAELRPELVEPAHRR